MEGKGLKSVSRTFVGSGIQSNSLCFNKCLFPSWSPDVKRPSLAVSQVSRICSKIYIRRGGWSSWGILGRAATKAVPHHSVAYNLIFFNEAAGWVEQGDSNFYCELSVLWHLRIWGPALLVHVKPTSWSQENGPLRPIDILGAGFWLPPHTVGSAFCAVLDVCVWSSPSPVPRIYCFHYELDCQQKLLVASLIT